MLTAPPNSMRVLIDSQSRYSSNIFLSDACITKGIPPVGDLDIEETTRLLYYRNDIFEENDSEYK
jgi:hypothetical protein